MPKMTKPLLAKLAKLEHESNLAGQAVYAAAAPRNDVRFNDCYAMATPAVQQAYQFAIATLESFRQEDDQPRSRLSLRLVWPLHPELALIASASHQPRALRRPFFCLAPAPRRQSRPVPHARPRHLIARPPADAARAVFPVGRIWPPVGSKPCFCVGLEIASRTRVQTVRPSTTPFLIHLVVLQRADFEQLRSGA